MSPNYGLRATGGPRRRRELDHAISAITMIAITTIQPHGAPPPPPPAPPPALFMPPPPEGAVCARTAIGNSQTATQSLRIASMSTSLPHGSSAAVARHPCDPASSRAPGGAVVARETRYEGVVKVAFQGIRGAYSETALLAHFGAAAEPVGFSLSEQVFDAVESGQVDAGFVPVENSIAGPVGVNNDLFLERNAFATAESYLRIEHCLLGMAGERVEDVRTVYSHPVALAQCREFVNRHGMRAVPEYDTAGAAQIVAERRAPGEAAIASRRCADVYGLAVLAEHIQTVQNNITRFLAFRRGDAGEVPRGDKTSLAFSVHHHPGALLDCLKKFAEHDINLTRLESRPVPSNPFEYVFFVDLLGGAGDPAVQAALAELRSAARHVKVIGSYPLGKREGGTPT